MIIEALDQATVGGYERWEKKYCYMSDLGKCLRAVSYSLDKSIAVPVPDARRIRLMQDGKLFEYQLTQELTAAKVKFDREIRCKLDELSGRADFIVDRPDQGPLLIEAKRISSYEMRKMFEPRPEHELQARAYLRALGIDQGVLLYGARDSMERKEFLLLAAEERQEIVDPAVRSLQTTLAAFRAQKMMDPGAQVETPWTAPKKPCAWCDYRERCWSSLGWTAKSADPADLPESIQSTVLDYMIAKESEAKTKARIEDLKGALNAYFDANQVAHVATPLGNIVRQTRVSTSYDDDELRVALEPLGQWQRILRPDSKELRRLLDAGDIDPKDIEIATRRTTTTALLIEKSKEA